LALTSIFLFATRENTFVRENFMSQWNVTVEEYTTPNPITASQESTVLDLSRLMFDKGIRHLPIIKGKEIVGIVSDRDLRLVNGLNWQEKSLVTAADIMSKDPVTVDAGTQLDEVAFEMSRRKIGSVIVTEGDQLFGIFTVTDALNALIEMNRELRTQEE
jgi:acetoin utilization protein AcuB